MFNVTNEKNLTFVKKFKKTTSSRSSSFQEMAKGKRSHGALYRGPEPIDLIWPRLPGSIHPAGAKQSRQSPAAEEHRPPPPTHPHPPDTELTISFVSHVTFSRGIRGEILLHLASEDSESNLKFN